MESPTSGKMLQTSGLMMEVEERMSKPSIAVLVTDSANMRHLRALCGEGSSVGSPGALVKPPKQEGSVRSSPTGC